MKYENLLLKGIKIGVILILFTPLILGPFGLTFSAYPKAVFFRTLVEIVFIFYLLLIFLNPRYLPKISLLLLAVSGFIGILILSSSVGINPYRSFFGDPERAEGLILSLHLLVFFLIIISIFNKKEEWLRLLKITVVVSGISSFAGVLQKLGVSSFYGVSVPGRVSGTLSNPDFFGPYIVLSIFLGIFVLLVEKIKKWKIILTLILILNCFTLLLSGTRGAWIGITVGAVFFFPLWFFRYSNLNQKKRKIVLFGILFLSILIFLTVLSPKQFYLEENVVFWRIFSIFAPGPLASRLSVWGIALDAWKERPILGWGQESFSFVFDKYFKADYLQHIPEGMYFDYPHNKIMELMATGGLLGGLSYFCIFLALFYLLFKHNKSWEWSNQKSKNTFTPLEAAEKKEKHKKNKSLMGLSLALSSLFISYFIQNLFCFDTICTYLIFFLVLGFINNNFLLPARIEKRKVLKKRKKFPLILKITLIPPLILLSLVAFYQINLKPTVAARVFPRSVVYEKTDAKKTLSGYREGINKNTIYDKDFRLVVIERLLLLSETGRGKEAEEEIIKTFYELRPLLEKDLEKPDRRPTDSYEYLARINERIYLFSGDPEALEEMEKVLKKALEFNDQRPEFYRLMGEVKILQNNYEEGEEFFQRMFELSPGQFEDKAKFYKDLGVAYLRAGDKAKATENFKKALDREYYFRKFTLQSAIQDAVVFTEAVALLHCRDLEDSKTCQQIYERAIEIYPERRRELKAHLETLMQKYKP